MTEPLTPAAQRYLTRLRKWATTPRDPRAGNKTPEARRRSQRASLNWWRGNEEARRHLGQVKVKEWRNRRHNPRRTAKAFSQEGVQTRSRERVEVTCPERGDPQPRARTYGRHWFHTYGVGEETTHCVRCGHPNPRPSPDAIPWPKGRDRFGNVAGRDS